MLALISNDADDDLNKEKRKKCNLLAYISKLGFENAYEGTAFSLICIFCELYTAPARIANTSFLSL